VCNYYCSEHSADKPVRCSSGKVNAIAGANRQRNQQTAAESESSTSTSDESSDDEMDREPAESVLVQAAVPTEDAVCDVKTDNTSVDLSTNSLQQDSVQSSSTKDTVPVAVRRPAFHIAVNRTDEIQVFCSYVLNILLRKWSVVFI